MPVPISNVTRRVVYAASGTGPYAFTFEILANTDIAVYEDDTLLTLTTDYSVTINANGTGSVTLVASPTGTQIAIVGNRTIARSTDFTTGGDFFANTLNDELDQQTIFAQQNQEGLQRALSAPQTDPTSIDMTLPRASVRAGKVLSFDDDGNPSATEFIGSNRGNWASGTLYRVRDIVKDTSNSNIYQCITEHTSSGSQPISSNADVAKWFLLVDAASAAASASAAAASAAAAALSEAAAETAETNAETAETNAETAQAAAEAAQAAAEAAQAAAETSETNAASSESNAASSASAASTSESNAASSASAASTSASNASSSASAAASSASAASTSETNAASSASAASTSASNASSSASAAASSASDAASSASDAEAALASFNATYLGAQSSDPTLDNEGDPVTAGDWYFNTGSNVSRIYNGSTWSNVTLDSSTVVGKTSNTGSAILPAGTEAERDGSPAAGYLRFNNDTSSFEGHNGSAWGGIGGAQAGGSIVTNKDIASVSYTIAAGENGLSVGPVTVASGVTISIASGQRWLVL